MTKPAETEELINIKREADNAPHGQKSAVYQAGAQRLGVSVQTLHRKLKALRGQTRKPRADRGNTSLTRDEAMLISAYLTESCRNNGKRLAGVEDALNVLRTNGRIRAERLDEKTGELNPLSPTAVLRALSNYRLHPDQLKRATPKCTLASKHPNHVWEIDPSLCVLYYLPAQQGEALCVMGQDDFYKNKPANIRRIEKERVWRYVITDHASGVIFVHYVLGAESGKNLVDSFIEATQKRGDNPFHGIPKLVMVDPGSANTGAAFKNLLRALGTELQVNKPKQPWAKGQVEQANNIVECHFEHRLRFVKNPPTTLTQINALAVKWMHVYNSQKTHTRTGITRYGAWMRIKQDELIIAPAPELMRQLSYADPVSRDVDTLMNISFKGNTYSMDGIPHVMVGDKVMVTQNAWHKDVVTIVSKDEHGKDVMHNVQAVQFDQWGFPVDAPVIGESYKAMHTTQAQRNADELERVATNSASKEQAEQKRKQKATPFDGQIDPMKPIDDALVRVPTYMPKRGTQHSLSGEDVPTVSTPLLTHTQAAKRLIKLMGSEWKGAEHLSVIKAQHPDGVNEADLDAIAKKLARPMPVLKLVGAG